MLIRLSLRPAAFAAALLCPAWAHAVSLTFNFSGIASPGAYQEVYGYYVVNGVPSDFVQPLAGEPISGSFHVTGSPGNLYVDDFSDTWSNSPAPGVVNGWSGGGGVPDTPENENSVLFGFVSTAALGTTSGSISTSSSSFYEIWEDSAFGLSLNWTTTAGGQFTGGQGQAGAFVDVLPLPDGSRGEYIATADVPFTLTGLTEIVGVPEPTTWALMLAGFAGAGCAARRRRREIAG